MHISEKQYKKLLKVIEHLSGGIDSFEIREKAGVAILDLLQADYFASYVWSADERRFCDRVFVNMDRDNMDSYDAYFQYHDPITNKLQKFKRAVSVNEVMPQSELIKTEFFNDFLARDGLYHGVNLYVYEGEDNIGDIRVWRSHRRDNFDQEEFYLLEMIKPHFCNAMKNIRLVAQQNSAAISAQVKPADRNELQSFALITEFGLTQREAEVTLEIVHGKTDQEIADTFSVSFSTIRTHIKHIYRKVGVHNRAALSHRAMMCTGTGAN